MLISLLKTIGNNRKKSSYLVKVEASVIFSFYIVYILHNSYETWKTRWWNKCSL